MIHRSKLTPVTHRRLLMLMLLLRSLNMPIPHSRLLPRIRTITDAARPAIITYPIHRDIPNHGSIDIYISHYGRVDTRNRRVIPETPAIPFPTIITTATISTTIIDTAIISYMRPPITGIPSVYATDITPVTRGPVISHLRRSLPITGDPEITVIPICPVPGYPDISLRRTRRLLIHRDRRRRDMNRNSNANLRTQSGHDSKTYC